MKKGTNHIAVLTMRQEQNPGLASHWERAASAGLRTLSSPLNELVKNEYIAARSDSDSAISNGLPNQFRLRENEGNTSFMKQSNRGKNKTKQKNLSLSFHRHRTINLSMEEIKTTKCKKIHRPEKVKGFRQEFSGKMEVEKTFVSLLLRLFFLH